MSCPPNQMDQASALMLSVKKLFEGVLQPEGKPSVRKVAEEGMPTEVLDEEEVLEAMEQPEEFEKKAKAKTKTDVSQVTMVFRQEFSNPAYDQLMRQDKSEEKSTKEEQAARPELILTEDEIRPLVEREFSRLKSKALDDEPQMTGGVEDEQTKMSKMFEVSGPAEFENDTESMWSPKLESKFIARVLSKFRKIEMMEKGLYVPKPNKKRAGLRSSTESKKLELDQMRTKKRKTEFYSGLLVDPELVNPREGFSRADPETAQQIAKQKKLLGKM